MLDRRRFANLFNLILRSLAHEIDEIEGMCLFVVTHTLMKPLRRDENKFEALKSNVCSRLTDKAAMQAKDSAEKLKALKKP